MSSPLTNLRKNKKVPLAAGMYVQTSVPFRTEAEFTSDESHLLEEITGNMAASRISRSTPLPRLPFTGVPPRSSNATPTTAPSDHDLMALMMTRVTHLQQQTSQLTQDIGAKNKKINILEDKVRILKHARDEGNPGRCQELEKRCLQLQQQVHDMEAFLADYGMVWAGRKGDGGFASDDLSTLSDDEGDESDQTFPSTWKPGASIPGGEFSVDYNLLIKNIEELNVMAGEGVAKIQRTTDGARLRMPDPVKMTLYANGIILFNGPFRPFSDPSTRVCVQDIIDGYFPSELQQRYPDGIPFSVTDKREIYFRDRLSENFSGVGQVLGGETKPSRLVPSNLNKATNVKSDPHLKEETEVPGPKLTVDQFLNKLPQSVIKNGRVIDIREGLAENIQGTGSKNNVTLLETAAVQEMKDRLALEERARPPSSRSVTTLRIRAGSGNQTFIVKMKFSETISDLRHYLNREIPRAAPYQIISTFPSRVYDDDSATLQQCGLVPNAALHLRPLK